MKRAIGLGTIVLALVVPSISGAKIDAGCSPQSATSAIAGYVKNAKGVALPGMRIELSLTNNPGSLPETATSDATGFYRICAGNGNGQGHNTYDVRVRDISTAPLYAAVNQPYSTYANATGNADFTPETGFPMQYLTNLTITPNAISTAAVGKTVSWIARSKAPAATAMKLTLGHRNNLEVTMAADGTEGGGPSGGGWNRWRYTDSFVKNSLEQLWWASVRGLDAAVQVTQIDRQPYTIDNKAPILGPASADTSECGPGVTASAFTPLSPPGTTNPMPIVTQGLCDRWSNGARSGVNAFSLTGTMCRNLAMDAGCVEVSPVLNTYTIVWYPNAPMSLGDYYFRWSAADYAGNTLTSPTPHKLTITDKGGQLPRFSGVGPGNLGSGSTGGLIVGSALTTPSSYPSVSFRVTDADGQRDLVPGTLRVRVWYGNEQTLVYDYDPFAAQTAYNAVTKKGGGLFNLETGGFNATGYPLQGKPPGRYIATASITDYGGNTATVTWHWILVAAL